MNVLIGYIRDIGLVIAIVFSTILIIDITIRLGTGSVKQLAKLIVLLDDNIKLVRREVEEIRHDIDDCATCQHKPKPKRSKKYYDDSE
jgi:hypothetical protein